MDILNKAKMQFGSFTATGDKVFDKELEDLKKKRKEVIIQIGEYFAANNTIDSVLEDPYKKYMSDLNEIDIRTGLRAFAQWYKEYYN